MLAAIGAELCLRAGVPAGVYASPRRWFVGVGEGDDLVVLDACLGAVYLQDGRDSDARHAGRLRLALPVQPR
jgi:hypothetical protein